MNNCPSLLPKPVICNIINPKITLDSKIKCKRKFEAVVNKKIDTKISAEETEADELSKETIILKDKLNIKFKKKEMKNIIKT